MLALFEAGEGVKAVSDFGNGVPGWGVPGWEYLLSRPEVDRVEVTEDVVRVRLKSGVELEWSLGESV